MKTLKVKEKSDFTYELTLLKTGHQFTFRDVTPKDFYYLEIEINPSESLSELEKMICLYERLSVTSSLDFGELSIPDFRLIRDWISDTLLEGKLMTVENWLSLSFQLMKQRFTSDLDWYEAQPMTKILAMVETQSRYVSNMNKKTNEATNSKTS